MGPTGKCDILWEKIFLMVFFFKSEEFDGSSNQVVAFKGIKIGDFNGIVVKYLNEERRDFYF